MRCCPAQYLIRFDDLCPTFSVERWLPFQALIEEFRLHPILAVVPANEDPELSVAPPDPTFWDRMRALESAGAAIALHGYRHDCSSRGHSLLSLARTSEFSGLPIETQRTWIRNGLGILRCRGLRPQIFVAPRHGFDIATLAALCAEGLPLLSDGFATAPFLRGGVTWIPQQLWGPAIKSSGLWTICIHPNTASAADIQSLREFLISSAASCTSLDRVLDEFQPATLTLADRLQADAAFWRLKSSRVAARIRREAFFRVSKSS